MLPKELDRNIHQLKNLLANPNDYRLPTRSRYEFYNRVYSISGDELAQKFIGWLGLITARRVARIYEAFVRTTTLDLYFRKEVRYGKITVERARNYIEISEKYMGGQISERQLVEFRDEEYHKLIDMFALPDNVMYSLFCAYKTMIEVIHKPLEVDTLDSEKHTEFMWTDANLASKNIGDIAVTAALAYSAYPIDRQERFIFRFNNPNVLKIAKAVRENRVPNNEPAKIDKSKMREFWLWWLTSAIPEAWNRASQSNTHNKLSI